MTVNGEILSVDRVVAVVRDDRVIEIDKQLAPLWLRRTGDVRGWLEHRAIDAHRTNSRLLKKALRLSSTDDADVVLSVHAATITDTYWFRPVGSDLTYKDVRFTENAFDRPPLIWNGSRKSSSVGWEGLWDFPWRSTKRTPDTFVPRTLPTVPP